MDVLQSSIDLRDLLSTPGDLDPSSPLSAPDLRLLIDRLQIHSARIKSRARSYILSHRGDLASALSRSAGAASASSDLSASLSSALQILSDRPLDLEIRALSDQIVDAKRELEEKREAISVVREISGIVDRIRCAREGIRAGRVVESAQVMRELEDELLIMRKEESGSERGDGEPLVFQLLRKEWVESFDELQGFLAKCVEQCVKFDSEKGRVTVKSFGDSNRVDLSVALQGLEIINGLDYGMAKVADLIVKHVMDPIISNKKSIVSIDHDDMKNSEANLYISPLFDSQDLQDGSTLYARLIEIIKFVNKFICLENSACTQCIGKLTWSRISDLIISSFLSKAVPDVASKLNEFQIIVKSTTEFEETLRELSFISPDSKDRKLSRFVDDVELHFANRKRNEILLKAKTILKHYDYCDPPASSTSGYDSEYMVDLLFQQDKCFISKSASQLMNLVHDALKDSCVSSPRVAKEFYFAARDALLLYKAIVPVEKHFSTISQMAIIVHNDFYYLFQEMLGLSFEYRSDFPSELEKKAVFVDIAPDFYEITESILQRQIQLVISILKEAIDGADGFQNTHLSQQFELAKFSIEQVVFNLEKVHIMWEPCLPNSKYKKSMQTILDYVFSRITMDMLHLDDIAAEETLQLQGFIHLGLENLTSLFESLTDVTIPSLSKFRKLADLFDMPLKSITTAWESGELARCGFTSSEVENFIKAIFADSPLRKECIWRIGNRNI